MMNGGTGCIRSEVTNVNYCKKLEIVKKKKKEKKESAESNRVC
jgi:hypothetical protein